jgi:uncharacterized protein YjbI with pentapeptide repeats
MARSRPAPAAIGATQLPDLDLGEPELVEVGDAESYEEVRLKGVSFEGTKLRGLQLVDVWADRVSAANGDWGGGLLRRVVFEEARLTGLSLGEARIEEVHFKSCKLDYANFRHSTIEFASFEDCVLANADFQGARIYATRFSGCQLAAADLTKAELAHVDFRGSELALGGSVLGLRGAIVDPLQLMDLAPAIAHELGIVVEDA